MTILDQIMEAKKEEVKNLRKEFSKNSFADSEYFNKRPISFIERLNSAKGLAIIAEIKKASPSKGVINSNFDHIEIAKIYFENNIEAVSILTDEKFFQGSTKFLNDIAKFKSAPLLRKDFIIDELQVYQSKGIGADLILLIAELLSPSQILELTSAAHEMGMEVLLELHSENQIPKINFNFNKIIGINNRNLNTFQVDLSATIKIGKQLPEYVNIISESGIREKNDIELIRKTNTKAILIGEHLISSTNIDYALKKLIGWCNDAS